MAESLEGIRRALAGHYDVEKEIGQGGMATVYLADDRKHHRKVAIKVLRPELAAAVGPERFFGKSRLPRHSRTPTSWRSTTPAMRTAISTM